MSLGEIVTRVLIVDDQPKARRSLEALLSAMRWNDIARSERGNSWFETVGEASDGHAAIDQVELLHPDVVLIDLHQPTPQTLLIGGLAAGAAFGIAKLIS